MRPLLRGNTMIDFLIALACLLVVAIAFNVAAEKFTK